MRYKESILRTNQRASMVAARLSKHASEVHGGIEMFSGAPTALLSPKPPSDPTAGPVCREG